MDFEKQNDSPEGNEIQENAAEKGVEKLETEEKTILGRIREKSGLVIKALTLITTLSIVEMRDRPESAHSKYTRFHEQEIEGKRSLDEQAYAELARLQPIDALEVADSYEYKPWAYKIIEGAVNESAGMLDPQRFQPPPYSRCYGALRYAENYKNIPNGKDILKRVVEQAIKTNHSLVLEFADRFIDEPYAEKIIEKAADFDPWGAFEFADRFITQPYAQKILEKAATQINTAPTIIFHAENFVNTPWGKKIVERVAFTEPWAVLRHADNLASATDAREMIEHAIKQFPEGIIDPYNTIDNEKGIEREVNKILNESKDPFIQTLSKIKKSTYAPDIQEKMCALTDEIVRKNTSLEETANIAKNDGKFLEKLMEIKSRPDHLGSEIADKYLKTMVLKEVRQINDLHEATDPVRFKSVENHSSQKLYLLMTYGDEELFTSSFNGLFNRFVEKMKSEHVSGDQLLEQNGYNKFRTLIKLCASFNRLDDFLNTMDETARKTVLERSISNIEKEGDKLMQATTVAEIFGIVKDKKILEVFQDKIKDEYERAKNENSEEGKTLYGLLSGMFGEKAIANKEWIHEMSEKYKLQNLTEIPSKDLFNKDGTNIQQYFFYNDKDGDGSFKNFLSQYAGSPEWRIEAKKEYVRIVSQGIGKKVEIYANRPSYEDEGPKKIDEILAQKHIETIVVVHRGHSYHAHKTIERIPPIAKIVSLGSCGGYNNMAAVLERAPNAHIISTKGTGVKLVNDQLLKMLNNEIRSGKNIKWQELWAKAGNLFKNNKDFKNYVAPDKNLGVLFLKAYNKILSPEK
ncbi:MAG: hypothetical protein V1696_00840 [Candidatus Jorgensenbacteria bacterium]